MSLFFNPEKPNEEAEHWMGLCLTSAEFLIDERFGGGVWKQKPELGVALATAMMSFVTAKRCPNETPDMSPFDRIAQAIEERE